MEGRIEPITRFSFEIILNKHLSQTRLVKFIYNNHSISVKVSVDDTTFFNRGSRIFYDLGNLKDMLVEKETYEIIYKLLVGRNELIGFIPVTSDYWNYTNYPPRFNKEVFIPSQELPCVSKVYISPDMKEYYEMAKEVHKKKQEEKFLMFNQIEQEQKRKLFSERKYALKKHKEQNMGILSFFKRSEPFRSAKCYRCDLPLFSSTHDQCPACKWMVCSCGACGCQYIKQ